MYIEKPILDICSFVAKIFLNFSTIFLLTSSVCLDSILENYEGFPPFFFSNTTSTIDVSTLPKHPFLLNLCHRILHPVSLTLSTSRVEKNTIPRSTRKDHSSESEKPLSNSSFSDVTSSSAGLHKGVEKNKISSPNITSSHGSISKSSPGSTSLSTSTSLSDEINVRSNCLETKDELLLLPVEAAPLKTSLKILTNDKAGWYRMWCSLN